MSTMTRAQFAKQLQDGLNTVFGLEYDDHEPEWTKIFKTHSSSKAYEEDVLMVGLGGASVKSEGSAIVYDAGSEGWVARYQHSTIALAFRITEESIEDNRYGDLGNKYSASLARSMKYTKEVRGASVLNNGFSSSYTGGDAKELFATDHPLQGGGTLSNELATPADFSEESLEDALVQIEGWTDDRGIPILVKGKRLIIPRQSQYAVHRVLESTNRSGTANNDTNALKDMRVLPDGYSVCHYLSDSDQWTIITDASDGLKNFTRRKLKRGMEGDFETGNLRFKASERYSFGWTDWRGAFSSAGA